MLRNKLRSTGLSRMFTAPIGALLPSAATGTVLALGVSACVGDGLAPPPLTGIEGPTTVALGNQPDGETATPFFLETESATLGTDLVSTTDEDDDSISYVSAGIDNTDAPVDLDDPRIGTAEITFPEAGEYQVYVRARIGPEGSNDDSFFVDVPVDGVSAWQTLNGLSGYTVAGSNGYQEGAIVDGGGDSGTGVWKWMLLDDLRLTAAEDTLTQSFRFATRENGLDLDKFAFAVVGDGFTTGFTTAQLDAGETGVVVYPPVLPDPYTPPADLLPLANGADKYLGMVCCGTQRPALENYFNQIVPENAGKWGSVEATRGTYVWDGVDEALELAEANDFPFRFHVLLWGSQQPDWIEELSPEEQLVAIREWFVAVHDRYGERIDFLEVANEFRNQPPNADNEGNYIDALGGEGETGFDWVLEGFRMAREIFEPTTQLMLNEYGVVGSDELTDTYVQLVELLQEENLIDAIGAQGHAFSTGGDVEAMVDRINRLGATGLRVYITEMDVDGPPAQQLIDYQRLFPRFWENENIGGITLWGYREGMWREPQDATLVYTNGAEKPALRWLKGYLGNSAPVVVGSATATAASDAAVGTEVTTFSATDPDGAAYPDASPVTWAIVGGDSAALQGFAFAEGTGRLEQILPVAAGTYTLNVYADVNATVSTLHSLEITVE